MNNNGCWIFISHSSEDIAKIRIIRNEFEKYGQNPLAFHLKCLTTDTNAGRAELDNLIKREIIARDWFVYCESAAAKNSEYVQMERDFVKTCDKKMIWQLNLDDSMDAILNKIKQICCSIQVYLSYSHIDSLLAMSLSRALKEKDFGVWSDNDFNIRQNWIDTIIDPIKEVAKKGFVIILLTKNNVNSRFLTIETQLAIANNATIMVFVFDNVMDYATAYERFTTIHIYHIPNIPHENDMHLLVTLIEKALERKITGHIDNKANVYNALAILQSKLNYQKHYHSQSPILIRNADSQDDYCKVYQFPCCGKYVIVGDGIPSSDRADGCCKHEN